MAYEYIIRDTERVYVNNELILTNRQVVDAMNFANEALRALDEQTKAFDINIFETMGMRNLSGIVGEYLGKSLQRFSQGNLHSNLHQDGYPDLLLVNTPERKKYFETLYTISMVKNILVINHYLAHIFMVVSKLKQLVEALPLQVVFPSL